MRSRCIQTLYPKTNLHTSTCNRFRSNFRAHIRTDKHTDTSSTIWKKVRAVEPRRCKILSKAIIKAKIIYYDTLSNTISICYYFIKIKISRRKAPQEILRLNSYCRGYLNIMTIGSSTYRHIPKFPLLAAVIVFLSSSWDGHELFYLYSLARENIIIIKSFLCILSFSVILINSFRKYINPIVDKILIRYSRQFNTLTVINTNHHCKYLIEMKDTKRIEITRISNLLLLIWIWASNSLCIRHAGCLLTHLTTLYLDLLYIIRPKKTFKR